MSFPNFVFNSPDMQSILKKIFDYDAKIYDLEAYDRIVPGFGDQIWEMIVAEKEHQEEMRQLKEATQRLKLNNNWFQRLIGF